MIVEQGITVAKINLIPRDRSTIIGTKVAGSWNKKQVVRSIFLVPLERPIF